MQCEYVTSYGQCQGSARPGERFCAQHSRKNAKNMVNHYRIAQKLIGDSFDRHAQADELKSLREEIALMRSILEKRLNLVENEAELVSAMPVFKDYALAIEKLVTGCHNMDVKLGNLLDKGTLMSLAQEIIEIMHKNLAPLVETTPDQGKIDNVIEQIGRQIVEAIARKENG